MKKYYILAYLLLLSISIHAQGYQFGLIHNTGYNFKVVAIPDFTSSGNTDVSDIGFALVLPTGMADIINQNSLLVGRTWTVQQFDATFLNGLGLGDGTKDVFLFNVPPGQSLLSHNSGDQIDLIDFDVSNMPISDEMSFLLNSDAIATGASGVLDSFYNSNIDTTSTQDYFLGIAVGQESFSFNTLSIEEIELNIDNISLYPNPATDIVQIRIPFDITNIEIEIYDSLGKQILLNLSENNTINVRSLKSGLYLVSILTEDKKITKKLIVR
ncbi:hypothetical protein A9Q86_05675 [Flavobacteriales bacterium 33_180_T64]|nr:hypothetical protein A9Q86_05675 [Flavobacteriales bacterium 33_180_T64]